MEWKVGDWVVFDLKVGQVMEINDNQSVEFSDGWFRTYGRLKDRFRPLTLQNKRITEWFEDKYKELRNIDGQAGFNYPDISNLFSSMALQAIDASDHDRQQYFEAATAFIVEAREYRHTIQGVRLFRRAG